MNKCKVIELIKNGIPSFCEMEQEFSFIGYSDHMSDFDPKDFHIDEEAPDMVWSLGNKESDFTGMILLKYPYSSFDKIKQVLADEFTSGFSRENEYYQYRSDKCLVSIIKDKFIDSEPFTILSIDNLNI